VTIGGIGLDGGSAHGASGSEGALWDRCMHQCCLSASYISFQLCFRRPSARPRRVPRTLEPLPPVNQLQAPQRPHHCLPKVVPTPAVSSTVHPTLSNPKRSAGTTDNPSQYESSKTVQNRGYLELFEIPMKVHLLFLEIEYSTTGSSN
jgi:hypothetical protein